VRRSDGAIFSGPRHDIIFNEHRRLYGVKLFGEQGFLTEWPDGEGPPRFVDRVEAARIALVAGQIKHVRYPDRAPEKQELFSEDLLNDSVCQK